MRRLLALLAVATLPTLACSPATDRGEGAPESVESPTVPRVEAIAVTLLGQGAPPRRPITLNLTRADNWTRTLDFQLTVNDVAATATGTTQLSMDPLARDPVAASVSSTVDDIDIQLRGADLTGPSTFTDAVTFTSTFLVREDRSIAEIESTAAVAEELEPIAGTLGLLDPRLPWFIMPTPDAPLGPGARWALNGPIVLFGVDYRLAAEVVVEDLRAESYRLRATIELAPASGPTANTLRGTGVISGDPTQLGPDAADIDLAGGNQRLEFALSRSADSPNITTAG